MVYEDTSEREQQEKELERTRSKFRSYCELVPVGMSVESPEKQWIEVNNELCRILGYESSELVKKTWVDLTHPDDIQLSIKHFTNAVEGRVNNLSFDKRFIRSDGRTVYVTLSVVCMRNEDGSVNHFFTTYIDNTWNREIEAREKQKSQLLSTLFDNLHSNIYVLDTQGRKILSNRADINLSGRETEEQVIGKTLAEIFPDDQGLSSHKENMQIMLSGEGIVNVEREYKHSDGRIRYTHITKIPLKNEQDEITGLVGIGNDITEFREMRLKAKESEEYFRTLIDISPFGIVISDIQGIPTYVSRKAYELFRIPENEHLQNLRIFNFLSILDKAKALENFNAFVSGSVSSRKYEYRCIDFYNKEFWAEMIASSIHDSEGKIVGVMIIVHEITERKKAEEELIHSKEKAEQSDRFKTALLRNLSHEIRTPLNAILGFSDLLVDPGILEEKKISYIDIINRSSDQLLSTIDNLVDISSIQAKIVKGQITRFALSEIINAVFNRFHLNAAEKSLVINISQNSKAEEIVLSTDRAKLFQVLGHLVSNAIKFTSYGQIEIGYDCKGEWIEFHVSDTGIGIKPEYHEKIFETFFQVESSLDRKYEGSGMGLSICKAYIELLGGRIWVVSQPGKGSIFYFNLPYHGPISSISHKQNNDFLENPVVLVADDLDSNLRYLFELLNRRNIKVLKAETGLQALEHCRKTNRIDIALLDLKMPEMDGYTAVILIKKIRPELPVVAQSAYVTEKDLALNSGFDDFICKPFTGKQVLAIIQKYINKPSVFGEN